MVARFERWSSKRCRVDYIPGCQVDKNKPSLRQKSALAAAQHIRFYKAAQRNGKIQLGILWLCVSCHASLTHNYRKDESPKSPVASHMLPARPGVRRGLRKRRSGSSRAALCCLGLGRTHPIDTCDASTVPPRPRCANTHTNTRVKPQHHCCRCCRHTQWHHSLSGLALGWPWWPRCCSLRRYRQQQRRRRHRQEQLNNVNILPERHDRAAATRSWRGGAGTGIEARTR